MIMLFAMPIMFILVMSGVVQNAFQTGSGDRPLVIITLATGAAATGLGLLVATLGKTRQETPVIVSCLWRIMI